MLEFDLDIRLAKYVSLAALPTPIEKHALLSEQYGVNFFIKRDDFTDPIAGGTKLRLFEYILQDALDKGATDLITTGHIHSNQCRLISYWGKQLGMDVHVFFNSSGISALSQALDGNMLMSYLLTKNIVLLSGKTWDFYSLKVEQLKKRLKRENRVPYFVQLGGEIGIGTLGIIKLVKEIVEQSGGIFPFSHVAVPVGTGHTVFGFEVAFNMMQQDLAKGTKPKLLGISVAECSVKLEQQVIEYYKEFNNAIEYNTISSGSIFFYDNYIGGGYSETTEDDCRRLIDAAQTYGLILDPIYTLKPFYGTLDLIKKRIIPQNSNVLFLYTGQLYNVFQSKHLLIPCILDMK